MFHSMHTLCLFSFAIGPVLGHMEMTWPYALHSKFNPNNDYSVIDYSMTSPLSPDGSNFPCKGYQNDRPFEPVAEFVAGSDHNLTLAGSATHNGGSCQISMSYDNGATFRVIKSIIGGCPLVSSYDFTVPSTAPSGNALLAWTWQNLQGNREFYMNCAQINVVAPAARRRRRQAFNTFESLPLIWKANLQGVNDCATTEGKDVVYPNPGPSVSYGNGLSDSSPPTLGTCDAAEPYGQTYEDLGDTSSPGSSDEDPAPPPSSSATSSISDETLALHTSSSATSHSKDETSAPPASSRTASSADSYAASFITIATLVPATTRVKSLKSVRTRHSSSISTHVPRSAMMGDYQQVKLAAMTTPSLTSQTSQPKQSTLTVTITEDCETTSLAVTSKSSQTPVASTTGNGSPVPSARPPYATGDPNGADGYLPCVPGTFLCTSSTTWQTCNYNDGTVQSSMTWVWGYERTVAAGMECLPFLSPYTDSTSQQQDNSPRGSYRDDRYIRARPDGDCDTNGSIRCTYEGYQFDVCDQGESISQLQFFHHANSLQAAGSVWEALRAGRNARTEK